MQCRNGPRAATGSPPHGSGSRPHTAPRHQARRSSDRAAPVAERCARRSFNGVDREDTMRAIVQDSYGSADVLGLRDIAKPEIGDVEVLIRVHAAGVDRGVWHLMTGLPYPIRLAGYGLSAPKTRVRGREVAGRVEAVGTDVTKLRPGDEVFGIGEGTFGEYACAREEKA